MTDQPSSSPLPVLPLIVVGIVMLAGCLLIGGALFFVLRPAADQTVPTATSTLTGRTVFIPTATTHPTDLPAPTATIAPSTATEAPTEAATDAPAPTNPPATNKPAATNPPPPTNTPVPPTAPPTSDRILNPAFSVENPVVPANQAIWFKFSVTNPSDKDELKYGALGAAILKDGVSVHFQGSYTNASLLPSQQLNWRDHTAIGTSGVYQLQLAICFTPSLDACNTGGDWELLAQPVTVTVQ